MKDVRIGESLWQQWHGEGYLADTVSELIYFTVDHVDMENEIVRRALASTLQRDGVADSLAEGFSMLAEAAIQTGWSGIIDSETEYTFCDENGETEYGDYVDEPLPCTWVEF